MANELCAGLKECSELFNHLAVSVGVLLAVFFYWKNQFVANYENLNDRFLDFMQLQIAHPGLGTDAGSPWSQNQAAATPFSTTSATQAFRLLPRVSAASAARACSSGDNRKRNCPE